MILIPDFREFELDRESYPNSTWSMTVDRILCRVLIEHGL